MLFRKILKFTCSERPFGTVFSLKTMHMTARIQEVIIILITAMYIARNYSYDSYIANSYICTDLVIQIILLMTCNCIYNAAIAM